MDTDKSITKDSDLLVYTMVFKVHGCAVVKSLN